MTIPAILSFTLADFTLSYSMSTALNTTKIWDTVATAYGSSECFLKT